jgi:type IV pilus assembly protein PilW
MLQKQSTLSSAKGFTLVELLIALGIGTLLLGLALGLVLSNRRLYTLDQTRTALNQNLRAALDILGADIRQAGERMPVDFSPIEVRGGNTLILRRNLLEEVLSVCDRNGINGNQDNIPVADRNPPNNASAEYLEACGYKDLNGNGYDDRIDAWRAYRCNLDGNPSCNTGASREIARVYIYDPVRQIGEWFDYDAEDRSGFKIHKGNNDRWQRSYNALARLYLLEERRYTLQNGILQLILNDDTRNPLRLVDRVTNFRVAVRTRSGTRYLDYSSAPSQESWRNIAAIEVAITVQDRGQRRELTAEYLPRNVLSD